MNTDLDVIVKNYPREWGTLRVYALGDIHVGSAQFNEQAIRRKIDIIRNDPCGVFVLCGDVADFGLKNSKTNVYQATMQPKEQIEYVYELFKPVVGKLTAAVPGNHEERNGKIRVNSIKATATHVPYKEIVVDANLMPGGYGIKHEYEIPPPAELQYLELSIRRDADYNRTEHKVMNYHTIQI